MFDHVVIGRSKLVLVSKTGLSPVISSENRRTRKGFYSPVSLCFAMDDCEHRRYRFQRFPPQLGPSHGSSHRNRHAKQLKYWVLALPAQTLSMCLLRCFRCRCFDRLPKLSYAPHTQRPTSIRVLSNRSSVRLSRGVVSPRQNDGEGRPGIRLVCQRGGASYRFITGIRTIR